MSEVPWLSGCGFLTMSQDLDIITTVRHSIVRLVRSVKDLCRHIESE